MIVICTKCQAKFRVPDEKIGARGAKVRCSKCQTIFLVRPEVAAAPEGSAPPPASARRWDPSQPDLAPAAAPAMPPPLPPSAPAPDPFAGFSAQKPSADPFPPPPKDPFAPPAPPDPFASAADPFASRDPAALATDLGDLLAASAAAAPAPQVAEAAAAAPAALAGEGGLALEERTSTSPKPASSAPFDGLDAGYDAFAGAGDPQAFAPGALELGGPADVPPLTEGFEEAPDVSGPPPRLAPASAAPATGKAAGAHSVADPAALAHERLPGRPSGLRTVVVNAVALAALLLAAVAILALWRTEGPIDAAALRPSAVLAALRRGAGDAPFATREVRSGLYERERAPPVLFVRGSVVSRAPAAVGSVRVRVEILRGGAVVAQGEAIAGGVPTPEEIWGARDAAALAAVASAAAARAPRRVRPGDAVPFLVAIADQPGDLAGASLRVEVAPGGSESP